MNILIVSSYLPYPLFSGGHIRLYNIISELSQRHKITLICEKRDYQTEKDVEEVKKFCQKVITVPRKKQWSAVNIIKTGFSLYPFLMVGHTHAQMKRKILDELTKNRYDLIHVETFYVMQNLPSTITVRGIPIVLAEQNIEHTVYKRFANQANIFLRPLFYLDILKMWCWEERFWEEANWVVVTSDCEKRKIARRNENVSVVPNGVDIRKYKISNISKACILASSKVKYQKDKREKRILFLGDFKWIQNRDAIGWILKDIWPQIKLKAQSAKFKVVLWVVGKEIPDSIRRLTEDPNVLFDEHAPDDTRKIYEKADLLLAPIRVGGGGKFKILESMASGVPVVTTSIGIEGIEAIDGKEVLIADSADSLVEKTLEVLASQNLQEKLVEKARELIEEKYDWRKIVKRLEQVYLYTCGDA